MEACSDNLESSVVEVPDQATRMRSLDILNLTSWQSHVPIAQIGFIVGLVDVTITSCDKMGVFGLVNTGLPLDQVFESRKRGAHIPFQTPFSSSPHIRKPIYHQKNVRNCSKPESDGITTKEVPAPESEPQQNGIISSSKNATSKRRQADSTDWVSSQLTRRFGWVELPSAFEA